MFVMVAHRLCDPASKRRTVCKWAETIELPDDVELPSLDRCYRALDALCDAKEETEQALHSKLTDLANLDLRLALYDVTSTYFERAAGPSEEFPSRAYGHSATSAATALISQRAPSALASTAGLIGDVNPTRLRRTDRLGGLIHEYWVVA